MTVVATSLPDVVDHGLDAGQNTQKLDRRVIISVRFFLTKCTFYKNKGGENRCAQVAAYAFFYITQVIGVILIL